MLFQIKVHFIAIIVAGREEKIMLADRILDQSHQRPPIIAVQPVPFLQTYAAQR
ncbi:hypothetical protein D3C87_2098640 [compost metagenome]